MKRFPCLRVLAFTALFLAVACMAAEAQQQRGGQRGQRDEGGQRGQRGPGGGGFGQRGPGGMRGPGMMGGGGVSGLLRNEQVQNEVKLTEDQKSQLAKMAEEQRAEMRERFAGRGPGDREEQSEADRQAQREEMMKEFQERAKKMEEKIRGILEPEQFKRLKQIELQQQLQDQGPAAFARPDIIQALGLTDEQQQSLKQIAEGLATQRQQIGEQTRELFQGGFRDASEDERAKLMEKGTQLREKGETARKEAQQKAMAVLTDEQKEKLKSLMGKFVKIEMRGGPGGPRPGGDRGGQDGGNRRPQGDRRPARPQA